jgi:hypothetical protein
MVRVPLGSWGRLTLAFVGEAERGHRYLRHGIWQRCSLPETSISVAAAMAEFFETACRFKHRL